MLYNLIDQTLCSSIMRCFQEDRDSRGHQQGPGDRQERRVPARGSTDAALAAAVGREEETVRPTFRRRLGNLIVVLPARTFHEVVVVDFHLGLSLRMRRLLYNFHADL